MNQESFFRDLVLTHAVMQAGRLVGFLNNSATDENGPVVHVFELCQELDAELRSPQPRGISGLHRAINARLESFRFIPVINDRRVFWRRGPEPTIFARIKATSPEIIPVILEMTAAGTIGRIRRCICGKWFFAHSNKRQVCSDACRFEKYQRLKDEDPKTARKKHADYVRDWRKKVKGKRNGKTGK